MASLSLATDLGLGQPLEHELGVCLSALELADRLGCSADECSDVYYVALLLTSAAPPPLPTSQAGSGAMRSTSKAACRCWARPRSPPEDIRYLVRRLADDRPLPERARLVAKQLIGGKEQFELAAANLCEGGRLLATRLHLPDEVARALGQVTARWDGKGIPADVEGEQISRPLRIVRVAHDVVAIAQARDLQAATEALSAAPRPRLRPAGRRRRTCRPEALVRAADAPDAWERVIAAEPEPVATISSAGLETVARAFAEFTDLKVGFLRGHSTRVAELAANAAERLGLLALGGLRGARRGPLPRSRQGVGAERDLGEARSLERRRVGAGSPPPLLHRAGAGALRRRWRRSLCWRGHTTSASTAPGTTAEPPPLSSASAPGCWPPPTPSMR